MPSRSRTDARPVVLIVDAYAPLRRSMRRLLQGLGLELHEASSSEAALAWLEQHPGVAAIITNQGTGEGPTGLALLERAQDLHPEVACFLYTGRQILTVEVWREAFVTLIAKPARPERLRRAIAQAVRS